LGPATSLPVAWTRGCWRPAVRGCLSPPSTRPSGSG